MGYGQITADEAVSSIDGTREAEQFRNPDRPNARTIGRRPSQPIGVTRAKGRLRTAAYRNRLDAQEKPSTYQIGAALVVALAKVTTYSEGDYALVDCALRDMQARGFDLAAAKETLKRIRSAHHVPRES